MRKKTVKSTSFRIEILNYSIYIRFVSGEMDVNWRLISNTAVLFILFYFLKQIGKLLIIY